MRDRMERFVLLPFTVGCISESSIAVVMQRDKRSKMGMNTTPIREKEDEEYEYLDDEESLSGEKSPLSLVSLPRFQKLLKNFKNFSQLFVYKDELEPETGIEIGFPTDVKHVTHIGLDDGVSSILTKGWNNLTEPDLINLSSFTLSPVEFPMAAQSEAGNIRTLLETKCRDYPDVAAKNEQ